jgi:quinol monooxygenase YgiN
VKQLTLSSENIMELAIFARFYARAGQEAAVAAAIRDVIVPTAREAECLSINAFRSVRDPRLFFIHSRWRDEAAFELHAREPHTMRFIERVTPLIDHELDIARTAQIG